MAQEKRGAGQQSQSQPQTQQTGQSGQSMQRAGSPQQGMQRGGMGRTPFGFVRRMMDDMDRLFGEFGMGGMMPRGMSSLFEEEPFFASRGGGMMQAFNPEIEVFEREGKLVVRADLPGLSKDDVHVDVEQNALVIEGERKHEEEKNEGGVFHSERSYGSFRRAIALPRGTKADTCDASFENGVLEITMDLPEEQRRRRIEVRSGQAAASQPGQPGQQQGRAPQQQQQENGPGAPSTRH